MWIERLDFTFGVTKHMVRVPVSELNRMAIVNLYVHYTDTCTSWCGVHGVVYYCTLAVRSCISVIKAVRCRASLI
jgi:hypothetical protein